LTAKNKKKKASTSGIGYIGAFGVEGNVFYNINSSITGNAGLSLNLYEIGFGSRTMALGQTFGVTVGVGKKFMSLKTLVSLNAIFRARIGQTFVKDSDKEADNAKFDYNIDAAEFKNSKKGLLDTYFIGFVLKFNYLGNDYQEVTPESVEE